MAVVVGVEGDVFAIGRPAGRRESLVLCRGGDFCGGVYALKLTVLASLADRWSTNSGDVLVGRLALSVMRPMTRNPMVFDKICIVGSELLTIQTVVGIRMYC